MMEDSNPEKPAAIKAVQAEIARINTEAQMNPDWWTDEELALWQKQAEALAEQNT